MATLKRPLKLFDKPDTLPIGVSPELMNAANAAGGRPLGRANTAGLRPLNMVNSVTAGDFEKNAAWAGGISGNIQAQADERVPRRALGIAEEKVLPAYAIPGEVVKNTNYDLGVINQIKTGAPVSLPITTQPVVNQAPVIAAQTPAAPESLQRPMVPINAPLNPIVNGVGGGNRNIVETNPLLRQAQDRGDIAMYTGGSTSTGIVADRTGLMRTPQEVLNITEAPKSPFRGTNAVENAANKAAYDEFQQRSKDNVLTGGSTGGMGGPTFNLRPSKEERVADAASRGAIGLARVTGKTAENVAAEQGRTATAIAVAAEAEKVRRAQETLAGKTVDAKARTDAATIAAGAKGSTSGDAKVNSDKIAALQTQAEQAQKEIDENSPNMVGVGGNAVALQKAKERLAKIQEEYDATLGIGSLSEDGQQVPVNPKRIVSKEQYDLLPKGSWYIDPKDGKPYQKK